MQREDIVITGMGVISPIGIGVEALWTALSEQRSGVGPLTLFDASELPVRFGAEVTDFDAKRYVRPRKSLKVMSRDIQFSHGAASLACEQAGIEPGVVPPQRMGVVFGADMIYCELPELVDTFKRCIIDDRFDDASWGPQAMQELFPLWMLKYLPNMPACHIGIGQDARGPNNSITLGEVSSLVALAEAIRVIERGQADVMIVGGGSSRLHPMPLVSRRDTLFSHREDDPQAASRPFDSQRDGMVLGEGAGAIVIERREHAQRRGVEILGAVAGYCCRFEPIRNGSTLAGTAIRAVIAGAMTDAGRTAGDMGHVNAHGFSTRWHDQIEAQAIRAELGDVPVTAPKSFFGNLGAAAGIVELITSVLALQRREIPVTLNYRQADAECPVNIVTREPLASDASHAVTLNFTTTGQAAAVIVADGKS